jgi:sortase A
VRRDWLTWLGAVLVVAGLVMIGYVAWQLWGTNYISRQEQAKAVDEVQQLWAEPRSEIGRTSAGPQGAATALIRVPRFGSDYVMPVFDGISDEVLAKGFGHFEDSAGPGKKGNYALAAHRITHGEPLRRMPEMRPGDIIEVETRNKVFVYRLDTNPNELVVTFDDVWVVDRRPVNPDPDGVGPARHPRLITLTTCAELFNTDDRMIAFGHLVQTRDKPGPA